jgi:hypothetical protein
LSTKPSSIKTATTASQFNYVYSTTEKLRFFLPCLRQRFRPRRHLLAGPFAGEFGYELMQWQGFVRARKPHYQSVHVLTYPGRDYLYEGCYVHYHDIDLKKAGYWYGLLSPQQARQMAEAKAAEIGLEDYDIFDTSLLCTRYHKILFWRQEFRLLEEPPLAGWRRDVAFHFRAMKKSGPDQAKNYDPARADALAKLCREQGLSAICVGHPEYAYCAAGCEDGRRVDLRESVAAICSAQLLVGENSGTTHLANLCGRPTVLWANDQWRIDYSLRWNPFRVPIYTAANNTCQPEPTQIFAALKDALADLRARTDGFTRPAYTFPARPIAHV